MPESKPVHRDYFDDAVFIGNSRTEGLFLYTGLTNAKMYAHRGTSVTSVYRDKVIKTDSGDMTIMDALKANKTVKKVYIMLGINELGWVDLKSFISDYAKIIDDIKIDHPKASIYVQLIMPVTKNKSDNDEVFTNTRIETFNKLITKMAVSKKAYIVNVPEAVMDKTGALPEEAASDGIHLKRDYCKKWLNYLLCHIVKEKED